jgi:hypothetical protein
MIVVAEKQWSYVLFDDGKGWVLTALIGGVVEVDVSVRLTSQEIDSIKDDISYVEYLVNEINLHRDKFVPREINPPVWPPN